MGLFDCIFIVFSTTTDGFDFLGWQFKVQKNGKFRSTPSVDNYGGDINGQVD
jgi:hypothetical protein